MLATSHADAEGVITQSAHSFELFFALSLICYLCYPEKGKELITVS